MLHYKALSFIVLGLTIYSCGDEKNIENLFSLDTSTLKQVYNSNENVDLFIKNSTETPIDSVVYFINDIKIEKVIGNKKTPFDLKKQKLGYQEIKATVFSNKESYTINGNFTITAENVPKEYTYKIINTYPHDSNAYTQGFEFYNGTLYEGTGQYGKSSLRKTEYKTGKVLEKKDLQPRYFGEGITILNNKVYQLTWKENTGFVYDAKTFNLEKTFNYPLKIEGWGLTNDGEKLYMSDGSEKIYILDPETLREIDYLNVYTKTSKIESLNELEWIDGKIWANVYQKDAIAIINPKNGAIEGIINLKDLKSKITPGPEVDVLNGIAYNPVTKTIFVTGKNWDKVFEITVE